MSNQTYKREDLLGESAHSAAENFASVVGKSTAWIYCGTLTLGIPSLIALALIVFLVVVGIPARAIERAMVWLSVPWFAFCYALCKLAHRTNLEFTNDVETNIQH